MKKPASVDIIREGACAQPAVCPLSSISAGTVACIKSLAASKEVMDRLREMGFCEEQRVKLLSRDGNIICQICNARLGISQELADAILVQPLPGRLKAA
jgi:Fe2+ transport system protein FeoA